MRQRTAIASLALSTAALGGIALAEGPSPSDGAPSTPSTVAESPPPPSPASPPPDDDPVLTGYALHEWGLVRFEAGVPEVVTSGFDDRVQGIQTPPQIDRPVHVRKPLIYLHPGVSFDLSTNIDITVSLADGTLHEVWPTPGLAGQPAHTNTFTWSGVQISDEACGAQTAPALTDLPCSSLGAGHVCEAAELTAYLQPVPNCLTYQGVEAPVLLYNGQPAGLDPPVHVQGGTARDGATATELTSLSAQPIGPLYVLEGRQVYRIERLDRLSSWSTAGAVPSYWVGEDDDELLAQIHADIEAQGLTETEAADFVAAWRPDVLRTSVLPWRVFGFYDRETIDTTWPLEANPMPLVTHRVMAFTIENPPTIP